MKKYPKEFLDMLNSVEAKRPKTVIRHILQHGIKEMIHKYIK